NLRRRGDHLPAVQIVSFAGEVADEAAGLEYEEAARGDVPCVEADLEESVVVPRGDVGEVERRRAGAAQSGGLLRHHFQHLQIRVEIVAVAKREAGSDQALA